MKKSARYKALIFLLMLMLLGLTYHLFLKTQYNVYSLKQRILTDFIYVKGGEFMMGDFDLEIIAADGTPEKRNTNTHPDSKSTHLVKLDSYYLQKFETTNADFDLFSKINDRKLRLSVNMKLRQPEYPAEIFWNQATDYCHWLGELLELPISLPTEAQWEFAARSRGNNVGYATNWGTVEPKVNMNILIHDEARDVNLPNAYPANPLGFYAMSGNLAEWVSDWYDPNYYQHSPVDNPKGPAKGNMKVTRGGSVFQNINWRITTLRTSIEITHPTSWESRNSNTRVRRDSPAYSSAYTGVRCALNQIQPPEISGFGVMGGKVPKDFPKPLSWVPLRGKDPLYNKSL